MTADRLARGVRDHPARIVVIVIAIAFYCGLIFGGNWIAVHTTTIMSQHGLSPDNPAFAGLLIAAVCVYIVATALPFVPGAEIGLTLIMVLGERIVLVVYLATVVSLVLSFAVGRLLPEPRLVGLFAKLGLHRTSALVRDLSGLEGADRIGQLIRFAPSGWLPWLLRHRFWGLAVLINLPGNTLLGGGGGIALIAGISRTLSLRTFTFCVLLAVCPIPLAVVIFGAFTS